jgi:hypothetical protein
MHGLMEGLEEEWTNATGWNHKFEMAASGAFSLIAFCSSFRGNEVFLTDLHGLRKYLDDLKGQNHVIVFFLGRYKGEIHHRYHLTPMAAATDSGLQIRRWLERWVAV